MSRLIFVNRYFHPDVSATSQMLSDVAFGLAAAGHDVHVVCSSQLYDAAAQRLPAREDIRGVTVHRMPTTRFGRGALVGRACDYATFYLALACLLPWLVRAGDVLVAKTDPPLLSVPCALVAWLRGARFVNWLQDLFPEVAEQLEAAPLPAPVLRLLHVLRDWSLRQAETNVAIGERMRAYLLACGVEPRRVRVIENWADASVVRPKPASASALRAQIDVGTDFVLGHAGNLGRAHDVETLLDAAQRLRDEPFVFLIVGGGAGAARLRHGVEASGLATRFRFLPYQPREALGDMLAAADAHLVSLQPPLEPFIVPSKIYGILAAARPALFVGAADGTIARLLDQNECGASVRPGDGAGLAGELRRLAGDPERAATMGRRASNLHLRCHTVDVAVAQWSDVVASRRVPPVVRPVPAGALDPMV